ncbi:hypothetical protein, partial [Escherichia coli]|uniref:hypothetical protein n=1 Tax=Escherichia coli TaxID=562 RepID=UPI001BC8BBC2
CRDKGKIGEGGEDEGSKREKGGGAEKEREEEGREEKKWRGVEQKVMIRCCIDMLWQLRVPQIEMKCQ